MQTKRIISYRGNSTMAWLKFSLGLTILLAVFAFFASGIAPPGICGEVLRHNQLCDIDASPLFYSEIENMAELEKGVMQMRQEAKHKKGVPDRSEKNRTR